MGSNKKKLFIIIVSFIVLFLTACGEEESGSSSATDTSNEEVNHNEQEEVITLVVNNSNPSTHHWNYNIYVPWKELVEEKTEGRVEVEIYDGATLGPSNTALQDLQGGVYDIGYVAAPFFYDTELFPLSIGNLPFAFPDSQSTTNVMGKFAEEYADDIFEDIIYMGMSSTDPYFLWSTTPIRSLEEVEGQRLRVAGKGEVTLTQAWGATPVTVPTEDIYESLQRNTIDGAVFSPIGGVNVNYYEVAPYLTIIPISTTPAMPMMSKRFYDDLPGDLQELFDLELNPKLAELFVDSYTNELENAYNEAEENGVELITPSENELNEFMTYAEIRWDEWVEEANAKGYPGEEMMEYFKKLLEEEGLTLPF